MSIHSKNKQKFRKSSKKIFYYSLRQKHKIRRKNINKRELIQNKERLKSTLNQKKL